MYVGINNLARKIKSSYIGVDGVARKVKAIYVGVNGVARLVWQAIKKKITSYLGYTRTGVMNDTSYNYNTVGISHKINNNHCLVLSTGVYINSSSDNPITYLLNISLDDNGTITNYKQSATSVQGSSWTNLIGQFNDVYGAYVFSTNSTPPSRYINSFPLDVSSSATQHQLNYDTNYTSVYTPTSMISIGNDSIFMVAVSGGDTYGYGIQCSSTGTMTRTYYEYMPTSLVNEYTTESSISSKIFKLSGNRFGMLSALRPANGSTDTTIYKSLISIYSYSFDSSGNITLTRTSYSLHTWIDLSTSYKIIPLDDDYFICSGLNTSFGFHIDSNGTTTLTNYLSVLGSYSTRIGNTDSVFSVYNNNYSIVYYDRNANTLSTITTGTVSGVTAGIPYYDEQVLFFNPVYLDGLYKITANKMDFT